MVTIHVALNRKLFFVHEELLCNRIDYFRAAFKSSFKKTQDKHINLVDDDPAAFAEEVKWVYGGKTECKGTGCKLPAASAKVNACKMANLWEIHFLADKYGVEGREYMYGPRGSWEEVEDITDSDEGEFKNDCKKAVRHHTSRAGPNECQISNCAWHMRSKYVWVFESD